LFKTISVADVLALSTVFVVFEFVDAGTDDDKDDDVVVADGFVKYVSINSIL